MENGAKSKDNPFSFKNFLKGNQDIDSNPGRRNVNEDADNPFSFRKFLSQGKSSEVKRTYSQNVESRSQDTTSSSPKSSAQTATSSSFEISSDFVQELPDFIQDHLELKYEDDKIESNEHLYNSNEHYTHTDYSRETYGNSGSSIESGQAEASSESYNGSSVSTSQNESRIENQIKNESYCGLPDFISGTSKSETVATWSSSHLEESNCISHSQSSLEDEIYKLREENAFLHEQLEKARRTSDIQASKIVELQQKMITLREAEAQETAALEKMVQQVELNLKVTTERAVLAEGQAAKLKQELKSLQALFKNVMKENDKLSCSTSDMECITEKANSLASQIKVAADNAEQPLRNLLEGVEHLRLLSRLVSSIGKVEEN
ncbi:endosome-associated-trafficking regulator 1-like [Centruroides vittatus]|uniref:endosome-associated-trafficking regulator 1-like n=1 Tax=Centruroides vittatus TaxID=120091 RepID=UPI00350F3808